MPVTALTESAAPPRASPSSLVITTPSNSAASAKDSATPTASWPVIASTTSSTSCGLGPLADPRQLGHQLLVDVEAAGGVDDQHVAALGAGLLERPGGDLDRVGVGALLVDVGAGALADRDQLLDRGRAVDVAGGEGDVLALPRRRCRASFAQAVVLPEPCRPAIRITVGPLRGEGELAAGAAHQPGQLLVDDLHHLLAGVEALQHVGAEAALLQRRGERL